MSRVSTIKDTNGIRALLAMPAFSFIYYVALVVWLIFAILNSSFFAVYLSGGLYSAIRITCLLLLVISTILSDRFSTKDLAGLFLTVVLVYSISGVSYTSPLIDAAIFVYASRGASFRAIAYIALWTSSIMLVVVIACSALGIIANHISFVDQRHRNYLGFRYVLYPSQYLFNITCLIIYLFDKRIKMIHYLALAAILLIIYMLTDSRLSFFLSIALLGLHAFLSKTKNGLGIIKPLSTVLVFSFPIAATISIFVTIHYSDISWLNQLTQFKEIGSRLQFGNIALSTYGSHPFGQQIYLRGGGLSATGQFSSTGEYFWIDCLYVSMFVRYGWIFSFAVLTLITLVSWRCRHLQKYTLLLILAIIAIHCMIDDLAIYLNYNTFILLIASSLAENNETVSNIATNHQSTFITGALRPSVLQQHY